MITVCESLFQFPRQGMQQTQQQQQTAALVRQLQQQLSSKSEFFKHHFFPPFMCVPTVVSTSVEQQISCL